MTQKSKNVIFYAQFFLVTQNHYDEYAQARRNQSLDAKAFKFSLFTNLVTISKVTRLILGGFFIFTHLCLLKVAKSGV